MDRGAWWATVHEVERVRHDLVTEHEPKDCCRIIKAPQLTSGESLLAAEGLGLGSPPDPTLPHPQQLVWMEGD